jgi:hypothetical protein
LTCRIRCWTLPRVISSDTCGPIETMRAGQAVPVGR